MALEGVLSTVAGEILKLLGSQASECFGMLWGLNDDLDKLRSNVSSIQAVLCDAEQRQMKGDDHSLNDWLEKLGEVFYDVEDVLDEISIEPRRREVMTRGKIAKQVRIFFSNSNQLAFNYRMSCQLKNINDRLDLIYEQKKRFRFSNENAEPRIPNNPSSHPTGMGQQETDSSLNKEKVIGRDDDISYLKNLLLAEDMNVEANVSLIAIVGMGGIGKTTLATTLFHDKQVEDCFGPRIWVWISDQFETNTILKKIIESATGNKPQEEGREALKMKLQKVIEGKKYLLVMDDVWNENENEWDKLKRLLMVGARGSKILITKRDSKVVTEVKLVPLKDLPEDRSWLLFKEVAFKESDLESTNLDDHLIQLGKEISKKCGGNPLVIRQIGRLLYGKNEEEWVSVKNSELLNATREEENNDGRVISTLKLSYNHLPPNLKQCFAYTSLFPKGYQLSSNELIRQWVAQGFIKSSNGGKSMEDIGKAYLNELCWRFFYEISSDDYDFEDQTVCMHDMMRDLAREVAGKKLYVRGDPKNEYVVSEQTRHISFDYPIQSWDEDVLPKLRPAKGLRTFILFSLNGKMNQMNGTVLDKLFCSFPRLRVLGLSYLGISKMSKSIKKLRHLRFLDLSRNDEPVSNSIIGLQNLQTLNLTPHFGNLKELPRDICKLENLRHLVFYSGEKSFHMPEGLKKLSYLQTLSSFVFDCKNFNKLREEFNELNCFIRELRIIGLEELRSSTPSQVLNSLNLKNKKGIQCLRLKWKVGADEYVAPVDETILEGLEPHPNVKFLMIKGYCGIGLPNWVSTSPLTDYLIGIEIKSCHRLQHLTQLSHLQALKSLRLKHLRSLISLSEWIGSITSLKELSIEKCPKLKSLPEGMRQLKCLKDVIIKECPKLELRCKQGGEDWPNISHVPNFSYESDVGYTTESSIDYEYYRDYEDDEDDAIARSEEKGKMKDCITNIRSFFLT